MNIWTVLRVIVFGIILGVFAVASPAVLFFGMEATMNLGVWSALAGVAVVGIKNLVSHLRNK